MIYYFIIALAVVCFTAQFAFTKIYEKIITPSFNTSLVMIFITNIVGAFLLWTIAGFNISFSCVSFLFALCYALIMIPYYVIGVKILSIGSLAIYSMFMMLGGMLVPFVYGVIFLKENLTFGRISGTVLLSFFVIFQATSGRKSRFTKGKKGLFYILCLLIFIINGMTGVIAKAHQMSIYSVDAFSFTILSCTLTALFALILSLSCLQKTYTAFKNTFHFKPVLVMVLLGTVAYMGIFLQLKAASFVPASVQFPLVSGGVIILSAITSCFVFREKISKTELISVIGSFISTLLFAF